MPGGDAEHPGPQRALAPERAQLREDDEQDLLRRVLGVLRVAQHPQRQPVAVVLQRSEKLLVCDLNDRGRSSLPLFWLYGRPRSWMCR